jgi:ribonucleoside-diphosphate reductase alpha chain
LSDLEDEAMRRSKYGNSWYETHKHRYQANNSAVYEEKPDAVTFMREWLALAESGSGERGIFNRGGLRKQLPARRKKNYPFGINPCGEIILRHKQFCNTTMAVLRKGLDWLEILRRVGLATIWGTIQSTMTRFGYIGPEWKKNSEEERLLGVDILGHLDHDWFKPGTPGMAERLQQIKEHVLRVNQQWAARLGIAPSTANTCVKPGGDSGVLFDAAPGIKAWHGQYFIRRCTVEDTNPVFQLLRDQGVPVKPSKDGLYLLEFPCRAPDDAVLLNQQNAIQQLEHWKTLKVHYTEHNPSATIYVGKNEWMEVGNWVYANWDIVGGLSFYPHDDAVYENPPFEAISQAEYEQRAAAFPDIQWAKLCRYETDDRTTLQQTVACSGGACHI